MRLALGLKIENLHAFCDSQLVVNQFSGEYAVKEDRMGLYLQIVKDLAGQFKEFTLTRVPRGENTSADALAVLASTSDPDLRRIIPVEFIEHPSIRTTETVNTVTRSQAAKHTSGSTKKVLAKTISTSDLRETTSVADETDIVTSGQAGSDVGKNHIPASAQSAKSNKTETGASTSAPECPSTSEPGMSLGLPVSEVTICGDPGLGQEDVVMTEAGNNPSNNPHDNPDDYPDPTADEEESLESHDDVTNPEYGCDKSWLGNIRGYINDGERPSGKWAARKLKAQAARYVLLDGEVFKWSFSGPLLKCVEGETAQKIMEEVHSGSCGNHSGGRALAIRIKRHGHYWPTMIRDCEVFSAKCEQCQRHAPKIHQPTEMLSSITSPPSILNFFLHFWSIDFFKDVEEVVHVRLIVDNIGKQI